MTQADSLAIQLLRSVQDTITANHEAQTVLYHAAKHLETPQYKCYASVPVLEGTIALNGIVWRF